MQLFHDQYLSMKITSADTIHQCAAALQNGLSQITNFKDLYICMLPEQNSSTSYRNDHALLKFHITEQTVQFEGIPFPLELLLPRYGQSESSEIYYFKSLSYQNHVQVYAAISFSDHVPDGNEQYLELLMHFFARCNHIEMKGQLHTLMHAQKRDADRDPVTGLYHQQSCRLYLSEMLEQAKQSGEKVMVFYINMDNLYSICETYGYEEGNRILNAIADRIQKSLSASEKTARFEENSFVIAGIGDYLESDILTLQNAVIKQIMLYHKENTLLDSLHFHSAIYCETPQKNTCVYAVIQMLQEQVLAAKQKEETDRKVRYYAAFTQLREQVYLHPERDYSIDSFCKKQTISKGHFYRLYREYFQVSFHRDLICAKIILAKYLLTSSDDSIKKLQRNAVILMKAILADNFKEKPVPLQIIIERKTADKIAACCVLFPKKIR
ncbi:MAG: GGDEF domain-containing protein [Ruminococcus sp.]|nr:GGDEF domain-containing protein [Ruminococcus sp.]